MVTNWWIWSFLEEYKNKNVILYVNVKICLIYEVTFEGSASSTTDPRKDNAECLKNYSDLRLSPEELDNFLLTWN